MKSGKVRIYAISLLVLLAGCVDNRTQDRDGPIRIVTTTGMITDITKNVGGEFVEVDGLMGPGIDPHLYKASESDVNRLSQAEIILYSGLHLEAQMGEIFESLDGRKTTAAVTDYIDRSELLDFPAYPGQYDPHVWFNVRMWISATEVVRDTLARYDPSHSDEYAANAKNYTQKLTELQEYVKTRAGEVPDGQRILVTAHDAFSYFGKEYGFTVKGLQGISTESEAGTQEVQALVDFVVERKIKAIFVESSVPVRRIQAVKEAVQSKGWDVQIGGQLYSDAMGDEGTFEGTYIGMVTHNIDVIVEGLK